MIRQFRCWFVVLGMLVLSVGNLRADNVADLTWGVVSWTQQVLSRTWTPSLSPYAPPCSVGNGAQQCGFFYPASGLSSLTGAYGWHGYTGLPGNSSSSQTYLNSLNSEVSFSITSSAALYNNNGTAIGLPWRSPTDDHGYFLSTNNATTTPGITLNFQYPVKTFAFYWGSVDTWNTIVFTDTRGIQHTFTGFDLTQTTPMGFGFPSCGNPAVCPDMSSISVRFDVPQHQYPWTSVSFSSCNAWGHCQPAFESTTSNG